MSTQPKWTPGKWRVDPENNGDIQAVDGPLEIASVDPRVLTGGIKPDSAEEIIANAVLIASAPDLYAEHDDWAAQFGKAVIAFLQGDDSVFADLAHNMPIEFDTDGSPRLRSTVLRRARGEA